MLRSMLFALSFLLSTCATAAPKLPEMTDMASMDFTADGVAYDGIATLPDQKEYNFVFKIPEKTAMFAIHNCNGEVFLPQPEKATTVAYRYVPYGIEREGSCILVATAISPAGEKIFSMIDFVYVSKKEPKETLKAWVQCNRRYISATGALLCQSRGGYVDKDGKKVDGDIQRVCLSYEGTFAAAGNKSCEPPKQSRDSFTCYDVPMSQGKCVYLFGTKDNGVFRYTSYGYKGVIQ